jgi:glycosyltransferase involved in cell wall biosynthesis
MKFSVIIPTFRRVDFLKKAIESVANQTYQDYEIVVVNDNFEDKAAIDELITKFNKAKVIHHSFSKGGNAARNSGISNSNGELIAFLDDDDLWLSEKLSMHLKEHQRSPSVGLVYSASLNVFNSPSFKDKVSSSPLPSNVIEAMGKAEFCPQSSCVTIKRECVIKCGLFDETLANLQDWDYWFRIAHFFEFAFVPSILVHYKEHLGDRTSRNETKRRKGLDQICKKWKTEIDVPTFKRNTIKNLYYKNSANELMAGNKLTAFKKSFKLLSKEVISIKSIKNFIKIFLYLLIKRRNGLTSK